MKRSVLLAAGIVLAISLTGCSLFTSGNGESGSGDGNSGMQSIPISDSITHEPPTDLGAVTQYALYSGEANSIGQLYEEQLGLMMTAEYVVIYGDAEDVPVCAYVYNVFDGEEGANTFAEMERVYNDNITVDGNTVCEIRDQQYLDDEIESYIAMNVMDEKTAKAYTDMYAEMDELEKYGSK